MEVKKFSLQPSTNIFFKLNPDHSIVWRMTQNESFENSIPAFKLQVQQKI